MMMITASTDNNVDPVATCTDYIWCSKFCLQATKWILGVGSRFYPLQWSWVWIRHILSILGPSEGQSDWATGRWPSQRCLSRSDPAPTRPPRCRLSQSRRTWRRYRGGRRRWWGGCSRGRCSCCTAGRASTPSQTSQLPQQQPALLF